MNAKELEKVVERYRNGEVDLFDDIYYETQKGVYLTISTIIKDKSTIEDLMQDVYLKAIQNLASYRVGTNFNAWICTIARNHAINYYNRKKRETLVDEIDEEYLFTTTDNRDSLLAKALSILEGEEREIILYHIVLNFKFKDIANMLNIPLSTAFFIYKKALNKIKKELWFYENQNI